MDRRGARAALLTLAGAALLAAAAEPAGIRSARWLAAGSDPVAAIGREPAECLIVPAEPALRRSVEVGRAAFRAPLLLGGQAARAGLSCNACHVNGHGNPRFVFPGLSGAPGTADVTSSLMSTSRGDGKLNPVAIPSLYGAGRTPRRHPELEAFIRGLVVDEFAGTEPPVAVLKGLGDYVRALAPVCTERAVDVTLAARAADVDAAAASAAGAMRSRDAATARLLVLAVRDGLGQIAERYPAGAFPAEAALIRAADLELAALLADPDTAALRLAAWRAQLPARVQVLAAAEPRSLFDHGRLAAAADGR